MPRRCVMFTPGDRPEMLRKAPSAGADVVVFDLEDAVAPARKAEARAAVTDVLGDPEFDPDAEVCVRVRPIGSGAREDVRALGEDAAATATLDSLMLPKVTGRTDVDRLRELGAEAGLERPVLALIESARGVQAADAIADAEGTDALVFGAEDLAADVGAERTSAGTEVLYARQRVVVAAGAASVDAIDTVHTDFDDEAGLREAAAEAREFGYDGKLAIHPSQVGPITEAFTPDPERVAWARRVLDAREAADADERGVFEVDGEMIDAPLLARAERIVERAPDDV